MLPTGSAAACSSRPVLLTWVGVRAGVGVAEVWEAGKGAWGSAAANAWGLAAASAWGSAAESAAAAWVTATAAATLRQRQWGRGGAQVVLPLPASLLLH